MKILLDTHIIIWFLEDNSRLREEYIEFIRNPLNVIYFSPVSIAELAIKASKNKLKYPDDIIKICLNEGFEELPLSSKHSVLLKDLPIFHNDPFDRLLIAQAISEDIFLMSDDSIFEQYQLKLFR